MAVLATKCSVTGTPLLAQLPRRHAQTFGEQADIGAFFPVVARDNADDPFGPVALFTPFTRDDEIMARANDSTFGLAAYGFTNSQARSDMLMHELDSGMVSINHFGLGLPETPFGGIKESGYGREGGSETLDAYFATRSCRAPPDVTSPQPKTKTPPQNRGEAFSL